QQGALPTARRADETHELADGDVDPQPVEREYRGRAAPEHLGDAVDRDRGGRQLHRVVFEQCHRATTSLSPAFSRTLSRSARSKMPARLGLARRPTCTAWSAAACSDVATGSSVNVSCDQASSTTVGFSGLPVIRPMASLTSA